MLFPTSKPCPKFDNFYFEIIKKILDDSIKIYRELKSTPIDEIYSEITTHIKSTSKEYRFECPNIHYDDPLCRLGYLFAHAGANATLFERTIQSSAQLRNFIISRDKNDLHVCSVGGGPGTELLGLTKFLLINQISCKSLSFNVLDKIHQWSESWNFIADEAEAAINNHFNSSIIISRSFDPIDVVDPRSYEKYAWHFRKTNLIIFNYLLSENKKDLNFFPKVLTELMNRTPKGCYFIVIDRLEQQTSFNQNVQGFIEQSGLNICDNIIIGNTAQDCVMTDKEIVLEEYIKRFGNQRPRRWFRTEKGKIPTVFAIVAQKP